MTVMQPEPIRRAKVTVVVTELDGSTTTYETCDLAVAPDFSGRRVFDIGVETDEPDYRLAAVQRPVHPGPQYVRVNLRCLPANDVDLGKTPLYTIALREAE